MLERQFLRVILLVINPIAATISIATQNYGEQRAIFAPTAFFLLLDWTISLLIMGYAAWPILAARESGYFRLPVYDSNFGVQRDGPAGQPRMSAKTRTVIALLDAAFVLVYTVLLPIVFIRRKEPGHIAVGVFTILTILSHLVCIIKSSHISLPKYQIKVTIVRRDQDQDQRIGHAPAGYVKEGSTSGVSPHPETSSPRPYRGSPSTKPTRGAEGEDSHIKLIEPTEGDALIADVE